MGTMFLSTASIISAQVASTTVGTSTTDSKDLTRSHERQRGEMKLEVGPRGRVLIRGFVGSVGTDSVTVKSWGGSWKVMSAGTTADLSKFNVGDYVGAIGTISTSEDWTIDAKILLNHSARKGLEGERTGNKKEVRGEIKTEHKEKRERAKLEEGSVTGISGSSLTVDLKGVSVTVDTGATTKIINKKWGTIAFSDITVGDKVRVYGTAFSSTITAKVVRDISIPR